MGNFKGWEILVILVLLLLLFGAKRLPDAARGLGRSLRIFKSEIKEMRDDDDDPAAATPAKTEAPPVVPPRRGPSRQHGPGADPRTEPRSGALSHLDALTHHGQRES